MAAARFILQARHLADQVLAAPHAGIYRRNHAERGLCQVMQAAAQRSTAQAERLLGAAEIHIKRQSWQQSGALPVEHRIIQIGENFLERGV